MATLRTVEYGDTLLKELQDAGATSKEVVGALNDLNSTVGVGFDLAYRTYTGAGGAEFYLADYTGDYGS